MDEVNPEFARTDVTLVIGANDVTNPAAKNEPGSPIYGMPILEVSQSKSVLVLKRSMASGFAGIDNPLFYEPETSMLFGDAKQSVSEITAAIDYPFAHHFGRPGPWHVMRAMRCDEQIRRYLARGLPGGAPP